MNSKLFFLYFFQFLKLTSCFEIQKKSPNFEKNFALFLKKFPNLKSLETLNNSFILSENISDEKKFNSGFSFGIENRVEIEIPKAILNFLEKNKEPIKNSIMLGCGAGGFSDITSLLALKEKNPDSSIFYNDHHEDLFKLFKERIPLIEVKLNKIICNFFELDLEKSLNNKFDLILANTCFHIYNERNKRSKNNFEESKNSIEENQEKYSFNNFIEKNIPEILNKNGSFIITCNFIFYLNNKPLILGPLENYLKKSLDKTKKLLLIFNFLNEKKDLEKKDIIEISEKINSENNFYDLSLFPHDLIPDNEIFIKNLKENFSKIIINYPNNSNYNFESNIILEEYEDKDLIYILRKNPLVTISECFLRIGKIEFEEFLKTKTQFGIFFQLFKK